MSSEIVKILLEYTTEKNRQLMIIASRNQVDATSGYVMTTQELAENLRLRTDQLMLCRDHCGPYFLDQEKNLSIHDAIEATKKTIANDIENGFDLIHIDTSRVENDPYGVAEQLIDFCLSKNSNIKFEFGTEENVGVAAGAIKYRQDLDFAKNFPNMKFVVAQTGSLCFEDQQAGTFEIETVKELVELANSNGVGLKEHNADYLTYDQIQLRKTVGVHAMNIAPQLGVIQTRTTQALAKKFQLESLWEQFANLTVSSGKWKKWTHSDNAHQKVTVAGHYMFTSPEYLNLVSSINNYTDFYVEIKKQIFDTLDLYYDSFQ